MTSRRILVTGGSGFLGRCVLAALRSAGARELIVPRAAEHDLRDAGATRRLIEASRPDLLIHLAARVGGIGANRRHPGTFFFDNMAMGMNVLEAARAVGVGKVVMLGTICSYPKFTPTPFREADLWNGYPEETNAPYGIAKKALLVMQQAYRQEFGLQGVFLMPVNLYGPGDNFDPEDSHVVPALIRKCLEARDRGDASITCWGTGSATREFLFVEDCAAGIVAAALRYDGDEPVNLGSGQEISIRDLVIRIAAISEFKGEIRWDTSRPDGQPRRLLDTSRAEALFGWRATTSLDEGLRRTIEWYEAEGRSVRRAAR